MSATCPIGDCGYAGKPASVEAHVSASTTGGHLGTLGREVREQIEAEIATDVTDRVFEEFGRRAISSPTEPEGPEPEAEV